MQQEVPVAAAAAAAGSSLQHVRGQAQAALQVEQQVQTQVIPEITTDLFGAVSPVEDQAIKEGVFENKDGHRWVWLGVSAAALASSATVGGGRSMMVCGGIQPTSQWQGMVLCGWWCSCGADLSVLLLLGVGHAPSGV